jgi:hypothetical protein
MSISINAVIRKDKINRNNHAPINIRLTHKSKNRYVSTGVRHSPEIDLYTIGNNGFCTLSKIPDKPNLG